MIRDRISQLITYLSGQIRCSQGNILLGRVSGAGPAQEITLGTGLSFSGTVLNAAPSTNISPSAIAGTAMTLDDNQSVAGSKTFLNGISIAGGIFESVDANSTFDGGTLAHINAVAISFETGTIWTYSGSSAATHRAALGIPTYANLAAANSALAAGQVYFDSALGTLNSATA